jgi:nitroimidazol reductase NimA-like FMN-containing flavoprotein (pyridoxamine 5'-phosphate oxidase superfamily)
MSLSMTRAEREAFLAEVHVAVLCVNQPLGGPLAVPVWYSYEPGGVVTVMTGATSRKGRCIMEAGRFTLCVQTEVPPYKYVSVEGAVTKTEHTVDPDERRRMAHRYLGQEFGDLYIESTEDQAAGNVVFRMTPESWMTTDYAKQFA